MKRLNQWLIGLAALCGLVCGAHAAQELPSAIRIAVPDTSTTAKRYSGGMVDILVDQKRFEQEFAKDGIKIEWVYVRGAGPAINEALANQQVDFAYYGDLPAIVGRANGLDTQLISASRRNSKAYLGVTANSGIHSLADLKGKKLAVFRGTTYHLSLIRALDAQGLSERDLKITSMDTSASTAALVAGLVDAVWGANNLLTLDQRGLAKVALTTHDLNNVGATHEVVVGRKAFIDRYPEVVVRLLKAHQKGYEWLADVHNKAPYLVKASEWSGYPPALLERDLGDEDFADHYSPRLDAPFLDTLQADIAVAQRLRLIRQAFPLADWVRPEFQAQALAASQTAALAPSQP
ncbi:ABC transporter substrate-binding protein [Pseudomonas putida]|uniref:ABC transporter substrate-binding protein n=1 Tax=Pseudomonas putida TaxID=303 RepID=A0A7W2QIR6_PSEPU|nr:MULTISPECIES: ABC transporter substrate-binding protein [Pseudomonas]MBA6115749.1 ABC transporter substrate-binding protein [Pseudomonas putida]MBI6943010.1 ABC transporter substrate-binding protein [Pseudomonas putida]MBI6959192.1 ABC transporter substrate-binding protein [Pseudomonas putida]MCZ9638021.1 ABC transporter substrate-binding protein [Pseudomonas putida]MEC4874115.1 ABC transporter substrate-binding protein [Pseudomonas sp. NC26]